MSMAYEIYKRTFWAEKVIEALETLTVGNQKKVEIIKDEICFYITYKELNFKVWIRKNYIEIISSFDTNATLVLDEVDFEAISYLFAVRGHEPFIRTIQNWIDKKSKVDAKQNYTNKLRLIQNEVSYLYDKIEDIIKKEVKESL